jgi:Holliday junction DNA helicase, RuvB subunit
MSNNDNYLRPQKLDDFFGQNDIIRKLKIYINSAKIRKTVLDHLLFYGQPGLGKTSLAYVIANEMNVKITTISASAIQDLTDLVSILGDLNSGEILFIDEIHNLNKEFEEILYSAMEDFKLNITFKSEENSKVLSIDLPPFTLIGATTLAGNISTPLRDRFGIVFKFNYYSLDELSKIIFINSKKLKLKLLKEGAEEIAKRSRKTPRVANNILKRILDYSLYKPIPKIDKTYILEAFNFLDINEFGLDDSDINILRVLHINLKDKPVSLETIAAVLNENVENIRDLNEPYLVNMGYIERTKQGRVISKIGLEILSKIIRK